MMVKVLYIQSRLVQGGPSNQLFYIIKHLDRRKFDPVVLTLSPEPNKTARPRFEKAGVTVKSLNTSRLQGLLRVGKLLRQTVKSIGPHIIHTQGLRPDAFVFKHLDGIPHCCTLRNYPCDDYIMKYGLLLGSVMACIHLRVLKKINHSVACSKSVADVVRSKHGLTLKVIQNGVDTAHFQTVSDQKKKELRRELRLPTRAPLFVSVGAFIERKDPLAVIEGFRRSSISKDGTLVMLGDGPLMEVCREKVAEMKDQRVELVGHVTNVTDYLKAADCFISMSHSEGLPNTVMEALASGLPVVLSDIASHREFFHGKPIGQFVPAEAAAALGRALDQISLRTKKLSQAAREHAVQYFSAKRMSKLYQRLYMDMIDE